MKVRQSKQNGYTVFLEIEEAPDQVQKAMDSAFKKLSRNTKVPGFRQGRVPRNIFEKYYGRGQIVQEALYAVLDDAYRSAIDSLDLQVVDYPRDVKMEDYAENTPFVFTCSVDVKPPVKLGKYRGIKGSHHAAAIEDAAVDAQIEDLRKRHSDYAATEKPSQNGDILRYSMTTQIDGAPYENWTRENAGFQVGSGHFGPEFDQQLTGVFAGQNTSFDIAYPDDFENKDVAGKTVRFTVDVQEVRSQNLPQPDDAFAQKVSDVQTMSELKDRIRQRLLADAQRNAEDTLRNELLEQVVNAADITLPPAMIKSELDHSLQNLEYTLRNSGMGLEAYLNLMQKTREDLENEMRPNAEKRVRTSLTLQAIAKEEKIDVTDTDIESEIQTWNLPQVKTLADFSKQPKHLIAAVRMGILEKKAYDLIKSQAKLS
ncbi:MAG: trigger factor [Candidatus Margulisiibacteriota bacterium]